MARDKDETAQAADWREVVRLIAELGLHVDLEGDEMPDPESVRRVSDIAWSIQNVINSQDRGQGG